MITEKQKEVLQRLMDTLHVNAERAAIKAALDTLNAQAVPVYCIVTDNGTYEHHDKPVPMADNLILYAAPPAARELSDEEERAAFENWAVAKAISSNYAYLEHVLSRDSRDCYTTTWVFSAWAAWQARAVLAAKGGA